MRLRCLCISSLIGILVVVACSGCNSLGHGVRSPEALSFSEHEIRSKTWEDDRGQVVTCLDWKVFSTKERGQLAVVQFGSLKDKVPTCLEFYKVVSIPGGYAKVYDTKQHAFMPGQQYISDRTDFLMVGKDFGMSAVKKVELLESNGSVSVSVTRESLPEQKTGRQRASYLIQYGKDFAMVRDVHTWISDLPDVP